MVKQLKPLWTLLKLLLLLALLVVIFMAVWLRQGPKSLNWAKPFILSRLNSSDAAYVINTGDVVIDWRDLRKLGLIRVQNVSLAGREGAVFATLPEIFVSLDPIGFLPQRRSLNGIYIHQPKLFLTRDKDKNLRLGLQGGDSPMPPLAVLETQETQKKKAKSWDGKLPFRHLRIDDFSLVISDEVTERKLTSQHGVIELSRYFGYYKGRIDVPFTYGKTEGSVKARIHTPQRGLHVMDMVLDEVPTDYICIFASCPGGLDLSGIVNGDIKLTFNNDMQPYGGQATLATQKMSIHAPEWFPETLKLGESSLDVTAGEGMTKIKLSKLDLDFEDTYITGFAEGEKKKDGWYLKGNADADRLNIEKLYKYWPVTLAPDSRAWITSSLKAGYGQESNIKFSLIPQDFTNPTIRDEAIDATVNAKGITVNYLPGFPEMHDVNGIVKFTGETITIDATSGTMLTGTTISKAKILCTDLNNPATPMEIETHLNAPAADAATLLKLEHFDFDDALELNPATLTGSAEGTLKLKFDAFSNDAPGAKPMPEGQINFDHVKYDIDLALKDVSQPKFAGLMDVSGANGQLKATNAAVSFDGAMKLGDKTSVKVTMTQKAGEDVKLAIDGGIARNEFAKLGLPDDRRFGDGSLTMVADITAKHDTMELNKATIDLSDMAFSVPEISWEKKRGAPATINLAPKGKAYTLDIRAQGLSAPNATIALDNNLDVTELNLPRVKTANSDFGLRYKTRKEGFEVSLTGNVLDASMSYMGSGDNSENSLLRDFPAMKLSIDLGVLVLMPQYPFSQVKGTLDCTSQRCESADISARASNADIKATIGYMEGKRKFALTASDAGDFLRALDITDRMHKGTLELKGAYDDSVTPPALPAYLNIRKFTLKNSQILGRILSIGSLTGLRNALTGSGIDFVKLTGGIHSQGGIITVKDAKATGNALAITLNGNVNTIKSTLNLKGVLVPAAAINTLIGKIPLLGKLAGGDEGLIAFNFSVKGPQSDPEVFVNPLSGLTPGFLRGIWGSNDVDADEEKPVEPKPTRRHQQGIGY